MSANKLWTALAAIAARLAAIPRFQAFCLGMAVGFAICTLLLHDSLPLPRP